jgi:hypothetical protein
MMKLKKHAFRKFFIRGSIGSSLLGPKRKEDFSQDIERTSLVQTDAKQS